MGLVSKNMLAISVALVLPLVACQSRFGDEVPTGQNSNGLNVGQRLKANEDLDKKLSKLEDSAERVRSLIKAYGQTRKAEEGQDVYTQLDFLLDVTSELQGTPVEAKDGKFIRVAKTTINIKGLTPECQIVESRLETMSKGGTVQTPIDQYGASIDGVVYSVRTCRSEGEFVPVATVEFSTDRIGLVFNNVNIRKALKDFLSPVIAATSNCDFTTDSQDILKTAKCSDMVAKLSVSEKFDIEDVEYDRDGQMRLQLSGKIYENDIAKKSIIFSMSSSGKVVFLPTPIP